ncbi:class I SAM-dependent methyltransferase [Methylococcus capsulatus]|uniref:class I SAM-dependent methyltransferase n=1 Tax=Methylococcus capsulatus TaxID=414 RepID=UPI000308517C|nr:class I SAM-dependent methyltransferase [Methylococcus capsulatus]
MRFEKQVDKSIYEFHRYMSKERWSSLWHQLDEVQRLDPEKVLEIGPGPGLFKHMATALGIAVETLDFDPELKPDHVASATDMPFEDATYDVVCAFQMLEHLPYEHSLKAFSEMVRVSKRHVVISLPDARGVWRYQIHVPKFGTHPFLVPRPQLRSPEHTFDGQHYWEINKRGYPLSRIVSDLTAHAVLEKTYRIHEMPYHRFFVFKKP